MLIFHRFFVCLPEGIMGIPQVETVCQENGWEVFNVATTFCWRFLSGKRCLEISDGRNLKLSPALVALGFDWKLGTRFDCLFKLISMFPRKRTMWGYIHHLQTHPHWAAHQCWYRSNIQGSMWCGLCPVLLSSEDLSYTGLRLEYNIT
jgi:hypothetical protein